VIVYGIGLRRQRTHYIRPKGCLSEHPLSFVGAYSDEVESTTAQVVDLSDNLPDTAETLNLLKAQCSADMAFLPGTLAGLEKDLLEVLRLIHALEDLVSCHSISPLIRRLTHGAVCTESPQGLTWIWGCSLSICLCCFVMLTTRSALYNAVKKRKKRDKKPKRVVEKEFEEYKEFMAAYYEDASEWKLQSKKRNGILEIDFGDHILSVPTLETERMSSSSDNLSVDAGILSVHSNSSKSSVGEHGMESLPEIGDGNNRLNLSRVGVNEGGLDNESDKFDSDYESDSDVSEDDGSGDDESALLSFYTETKSILSETKSMLSETKSKVSIAASHVMANLRSLKPLLGKPNDEVESSEGEEFVDGASFVLHSRQGGEGNTATAEDDYITPPTKPSYRGPKTPSAPLKPFAFLGRTTEKRTSHHELEPLTNTPPREVLFALSSMDSQPLQPKRLSLSPAMEAIASHEEMPSSKSRRNKSSCDKKGYATKESRDEKGGVTKESKRKINPKSSSKLDIVRTVPERRPSFLNRTTRARLGSEASSVDSRLPVEQLFPPGPSTERRPSFLDLMSRQRSNSDDSIDISLYIEDGPYS
jgi:hypothetical protein